MKCELVTIKEDTQLTVLTDGDKVDQMIAAVRIEIETFDGNMETATGRKAIITNANKARRTNAALGKVIDELINQQKESIESVNKTISTLRENKKRLQAGLTSVYEDARQSVTDYQNELKRIEAEEAARKLKIEIDNAHELALLMNEKFDEELKAKLEEEARIKAEELAKQAELQRIREEEIRKEAAEKARIEAEEKAKLEIERQERERLAAEERAKQAERDRIAAEERAKIEAEQAEIRRIESENQAEAKRIADIEAAKQAEIKRLQEEEEARLEEQRKLAEKKEHARVIHNEMMNAFINAGLDSENAELAVKALVKREIPHIGCVVY